MMETNRPWDEWEMLYAEWYFLSGFSPDYLVD